jgi:hypothetical protein
MYSSNCACCACGCPAGADSAYKPTSPLKEAEILSLAKTGGNRCMGLREPKQPPVRIILRGAMITFFLWCILLVVCWPLALLALILYPLIWLLLLPFRIVGIAVGGVLELVKAIIFLPARVLRGRA